MNAKYDEYRQQALSCHRNGDRAATPQLKADWLQLAQIWMAMIPLGELTDEDTLEAAACAQGTAQDKSDLAH